MYMKYMCCVMARGQLYIMHSKTEKCSVKIPDQWRHKSRWGGGVQGSFALRACHTHMRQDLLPELDTQFLDCGRT